MGQMNTNERSGARAHAQGSAVQVGGNSAVLGRAPAEARRRAFRKLRLHHRFVPLLVLLILLCTCGIVALAYFGTREVALNYAQERAVDNVRVERRLLIERGGTVMSRDGNLIVGTDNSVLLVLNGDITLVDTTRSLVDANATIYQLQGDRLVAIATNLPRQNNTSDSATPLAASDRALGDTLTGPAYASLLGQCGAVDSSACHHAYHGIVTLHGASYVAAFEPLTDPSGAFVGALGVAQPVDTVLGSVRQLAAFLIMVGLLVAIVGIIAGYWVFGTMAERMLGTLDTQLDSVAATTVDLEHLVRAQIERAARQGRMARQVSDEAQTLDALMQTMDQGQAALRESATGIWGETSQPGLAPDHTATLRWARQAAVVSARVGAAAEEMRTTSQHILALMNHVIAEGNVVHERGRQMQSCAQDLLGAMEQVEMTIGEQLIKRPGGLAGLRIMRRIEPVSRRLRSILTSRSLRRSKASAAPMPDQQSSRDSRNTDGMSSGQPPRRPQTGFNPAVRPAHATNAQPRRAAGPGPIGQPQPQMPPPQTPRPGQAPPRDARHSSAQWHTGRRAQPPATGRNMPTPSTPPRYIAPNERDRNNLGLPGLAEDGWPRRPRNDGEADWLDEE